PQQARTGVGNPVAEETVHRPALADQCTAAREGVDAVAAEEPDRSVDVDKAVRAGPYVRRVDRHVLGTREVARLVAGNTGDRAVTRDDQLILSREQARDLAVIYTGEVEEVVLRRVAVVDVGRLRVVDPGLFARNPRQEQVVEVDRTVASGRRAA